MILNPMKGGAYRVTQRFGKDPATYAQFGMDGHNGIDFAPLLPGMRGVMVHAPHEGFVTLGNEGDKGYGKFVSIVSLPYTRDGVCRRSDLAHFASFLVNDGQYVAAGDPLGIMGSTGFSTGIHTHWTYKRMKDGKTLDYNNGFKGALDIAQFVVYWPGSTIA